MYGVRRFIALLVSVAGFAGVQSVYAVGTAAGVDISSAATVTYQFGSSEVHTQTSNTVVFTVAEVLDLSVVLQDSAQIYVAAGASSQVLTYLVTNTGNGSENYLLSVDNNLAGDAFDPDFVGVFFDSNDNGVYDSGVDALTTETGALLADQSLLLFVVNNIPAAGVNDEDLGYSRLVAEAETGAGTPGTVITGAGDGGAIDAVIGNSGATASYTGVYSVATVSMNVSKSSAIDDLQGGQQPQTGATITYTLVVSCNGSGVASNVVLSDPLPAGTSYVPNSLSLDATSGTGANYQSLTDAADSDAGDFNITQTGAISVDLGDVPGSAVDQYIQFKVIIN